MRRAAWLAIAPIALAACSGTSPQHEVRFAHLAFDLPGEWGTHQDWIHHGTMTTKWTPETNDRKESIAIVRTELAAEVAHAGSPTIDQLLAEAQDGLQGAKASPVVLFTTNHGLHGVRVDVDFVPQGLSDRYHRTHVLLVDGDSLIHVLYTARSPSPATLDLVLSTIREGEG